MAALGGVPEVSAAWEDDLEPTLEDLEVFDSPKPVSDDDPEGTAMQVDEEGGWPARENWHCAWPESKKGSPLHGACNLKLESEFEGANSPE